MFLGRWGIVNLRKARRGRKSFRGKLLIRDGGVSPIQGGRNNRLEPHQHQQELMSLSTSSFGNSPRIRISRSGPGDWGRRSAMFGMSLSGGGNVAGSSGGRMQRLPQPPPLRQGFVFPSSSASASRLGSGYVFPSFIWRSKHYSFAVALHLSLVLHRVLLREIHHALLPAHRPQPLGCPLQPRPPPPPPPDTRP